MKKHIKTLISLVTIALLVFSFIPQIPSVKAETLSEKITDMSDTSLSSIQFVEQKLKIGYNIGNQFDGCIRGESYTRPAETPIEYWETLWTNPVVNENYIKYLKSLGIQLIRLPVSWYNHIDENNNIDADWLARVKEVVDMIINNDMYVIINTHHDAAVNSSNAVNPIKFGSDVQTSTKYEGMTNQEQTIRYLTNIWSQVGEYFKDYGSRLLFEEYNEASNNSGSMTANDANASDAKEVTKSFIQLIRSQGSNNANRFLVLPNYGGVSFWNADIWNGTTTNESVFEYNQSVPSYDTADDKLIMTTHVYTSSGQMSGSISYAKTMMNRTGCGAIIDEIGTLSNAPYS